MPDIVVRLGPRVNIAGALSLAVPAAGATAWTGVRAIIDEAELRLPDFAAVCAPHRAVLALLCPERAVSLSDDERAAYHALRADLRVHDTHGLASGQPLTAAAAALIADVLVALGIAVDVPELAELDLQSSRALREAYRTRGGLPTLHVGHDPDRVEAATPVWGVAVAGQHGVVRDLLVSFQLGPHTQIVEHVTPSTTPRAGERASPADAIARASIELAGDAPSGEALAHGLAALRWASEVHAPADALSIGVLLERHHARLEPAERAEHAWLTAVAATNAHFVDTATPGYDEPLFAMYDRAIALARDPYAIASLSVRRAFAAAERGGDDIDGHLARAAARVAALAPGPWATYYAAYLAIAEAVHALHDQQLAHAEQHAELAYRRLEDVAREARAWPAPLAKRMAREAATARFMIAAHVALEAPALAARWQPRAAGEHVPAVSRFEVLHWISWLTDDISVLAARAAAGFAEAAELWEPRSWLLYRGVAAGCAYQRGFAAEARDHARAVIAARARWLPDPKPLWTGDLRLLALRASHRAGDATAVLDLAAHCLTDPDGPPRAEVLAHAAWAHAAQGNAARAREVLDAAIDRAVEDGHQAMLLRVALAAAELLAELGDTDEAARALDGAWNIAEDEPGQLCDAPVECLRLCVLTLRATAAPAVITRACALVPAALADAEAWWDIPLLLAAIAGAGEACPEDTLDLLRARMHHRPDWQPALARFAHPSHRRSAMS